MFKKKIKLDCYTYMKPLLELQPLKVRSKSPSWWSKLKSMYITFDPKAGMHIPSPTVKACPGIVEYIRKPINLNLWSDLIINVSKDGRIKTTGPAHAGQSVVETSIHESNQYHEDLYGNNAVVLKLVAPWFVKSDDEVDFLLAEAHYSPELRKHGIQVCPGIVNFKYQYSLNVFLVIPIKDEDYEISLKYDTPLMSMFPMSEREVEIEMHEADRQFCFNLMDIYPSTILGRYYAYKKAMKLKGN